MDNNNTQNKAVEGILGIVVGFAILYWFFQLKWLLLVSIVVGLTGLFSKRLAGYINWLWMQLVKVIGFINSRILLFLVFFVILAPIAFLYRLFSKDTLQLKNPKGSTFKERAHVYMPKDFTNPW